MSYFSVVNLEKEPFSTSPDPYFFYRSLEHQYVLNRLEIAIRLKRGLSVVIGEVGTGKTTLSRALFQTFAEEKHYLFFPVFNPVFKTEEDFWEYLANAFGLNPFYHSVVEYKNVVEKFLYSKTIDENKTIVLVIDEGQKLSLAQLEILRSLLNYETNEYKMLQLVILGQIELMAKLKQMPNLVDRINTKCILMPLDLPETLAMIDFRLRQAGYDHGKSLFEPEAVKLIFDFSKGRPRAINLICQRAIEQLAGQGRLKVTADLVNEIIQEEKRWLNL